MRHLWSLLLAIGLTPLIYAASGVSAVRLADTHEVGVDAGIGLGAGVLAGGLYALLVMLRMSPLGPLVGGLAYLGVTIWALLDQAGFTSLIPADLSTEEGALHRPVGAGTVLLAVPLIITAFSPARWRGAAEPAIASYDAAPAYPAAAPSAAPSYADTFVSAAPSYAPSTSSDAVPSYEPPVYTPPTYTPGGGTSR